MMSKNNSLSYLNRNTYKEVLAVEENKITPKARPQKIDRDGERDKYERDEKLARDCIKKARYKCEINNEHTTFISDTTKHNYVEAHHLIPFMFQDNYEYSLDVEGNLIALCPNCHRKIHLAIKEEQKELIELLYNERKEILEKYGLKITLEDLLKLY